MIKNTIKYLLIFFASLMSGHTILSMQQPAVGALGFRAQFNAQLAQGLSASKAKIAQWAASSISAVKNSSVAIKQATVNFPTNHPAWYASGKYAFGIGALTALCKKTPVGNIITDQFQQSSSRMQLGLTVGGISVVGYGIAQAMLGINSSAINNFIQKNPRVITALGDANIVSLPLLLWTIANQLGCAPEIVPTLSNAFAESLKAYPRLTPAIIAMLAAGESYRLWSQGILPARVQGFKNAVVQGIKDLGAVVAMAYVGKKIVEKTVGYEALNSLPSYVAIFGAIGTTAAGMYIRMQQAYKKIVVKEFSRSAIINGIEHVPGTGFYYVVNAVDGKIEPISEPIFEAGSVHERWYASVMTVNDANTGYSQTYNYESFQDFVWKEICKENNTKSDSAKILKFFDDGEILTATTPTDDGKCLITKFAYDKSKQSFTKTEEQKQDCLFDMQSNQPESAVTNYLIMPGIVVKDTVEHDNYYCTLEFCPDEYGGHNRLVYRSIG